MLDDVQKELSTSISKAHDALRRDLAKLRAGRANPSLLDNIRVDYYGTPTPLAQMAHVNVPEPRLITVKPWDKSVVKAVEKALRESDLGLNPQPDGDASADDVERAKKKVEETISEGTKSVDSMIASKEKDIMEV